MRKLRQSIVDAVSSALKMISIANGYQTDVGKVVGEWLFLDDQNPSSVLQVRDIQCDPVQTDDSDNTQKSETAKKLTVKIIHITNEAINKPGTATAQLRREIEDILKAVSRINWPEGVYDIQEGVNDMGGQQESRKYVGLGITLFVFYRVPAFTD